MFSIYDVVCTSHKYIVKYIQYVLYQYADMQMAYSMLAAIHCTITTWIQTAHHTPQQSTEKIQAHFYYVCISKQTI